MAVAVCVPIAISLTLLSGVMLGAPTLRLRGDYLAIVTLGFAEIIRIVARNQDWIPTATGGRRRSEAPGPGPGRTARRSSTFSTSTVLLAGSDVLIIVIWSVSRDLEHSRVGRSWLAIREDEDAAEIMGVPAFKFKLWAFAIGAAIGGHLRHAVRQPAVVRRPGELPA